MALFSMKNKTVVVTGASSGIGQECAIMLAEQGAKVILLARDVARLQNTMLMMKNSSYHTYYSVDITDYVKIEFIVKQIKAENSNIDGIIHAAGISTTLPLSRIKPEQLQMYYNVNVIGAVNLTKLIIKQNLLSNKGGSVVFISSVMGMVGEKGKTIYGLTKGAILSGVKSLALELASKKIRVNAISPGVVVTAMSSKAVYSQNETMLKKVEELHPLGIGKPSDVAYTSIFLLSDEARWITGTNIVVDGGYTAR